MTKVIKEEFEKIKDVKDASLTYDTSLEVFNNEVNRLSGIDDDLFTYEVEVANISCDSKIDNDSEHEADDDIGYDPSVVAFTEWLGSKFFNYKTIDHYTMKALWIYWIRGDDEVELIDEESSDDIDEVVETYEDYKDDWIYEWNKNVPWIDEKPWTNAGVWTKPTPVKHTCKPFNYKTGCLEWTTCSWMDDGYCNGGNLLGTYIIGNQLHYQDYEWYEALEDSELKDEALRNKAIMEGFINDDDESRYEQMRRWNIYTNYDDTIIMKGNMKTKLIKKDMSYVVSKLTRFVTPYPGIRLRRHWSFLEVGTTFDIFRIVTLLYLQYEYDFFLDTGIFDLLSFAVFGGAGHEYQQMHAFAIFTKCSKSSNEILKSISLLRELTVGSQDSVFDDTSSLKDIAGNSVSTDTSIQSVEDYYRHRRHRGVDGPPSRDYVPGPERRPKQAPPSPGIRRSGTEDTEN
ncbi:hypothetical protein Tco_0231762 [Tanacetum coccineum]